MRRRIKSIIEEVGFPVRVKSIHGFQHQGQHIQDNQRRQADVANGCPRLDMMLPLQHVVYAVFEWSGVAHAGIVSGYRLTCPSRQTA